MKITGAPGCWGIEDPANPFNPPWKVVLDEAAAAGYRGLELGPYGYLPTEPEILSEELKKRNLEIVAGTMYDGLSIPGNKERLLEKTRNICRLISGLKRGNEVRGLRYTPPYLVVIDEVNPVRSPFAGHHGQAPRLDEARWNVMMDNISAISWLAWEDFGVRAVLHPHAGGYIEFEDEILRAADSLDETYIGLCLDTGHLEYSGMEPLGWLERFYDRLDYIHFKDIDKEKYARETARYTPFFEACARGVMCPIGKGCINYEAILQFLNKKGYKGYITIEQERDPRDCETSLRDVKASLDYLKDLGYCNE